MMQMRGEEGMGGTAAMTLEQVRALEAAAANGNGTASVVQGPDGAQARAVPARSQTCSPVLRHPPVGYMRPQDGDAGSDAESTPEEDALVALGRMVKGGARTLWRRVSHSSLRDKDKDRGGAREVVGTRIAPGAGTGTAKEGAKDTLSVPTPAPLAAAEYADVMTAWAGLGYYARARNLLRCARVVAESHGGEFPRTE